MRNVQARQPRGDAERGSASEAARLPAEIPAWLAQARQEVEDALSLHLKELESAVGSHSRLAAAVQYSVRVGGKRLRPILVLEACRVCGGRVEAALPAALAVELVHTFSLIHDDLPAMDDDDLRRGQPTSHKVFGEALAILAGDWLVTHAFRVLAAAPLGPQVLGDLLVTLAGGTEHMIAGQAADIEGEGRPARAELVQYIHAHKTGALIEACCRLGAVSAGAAAPSVAALAEYGRHLGVAFQITDDLLDAGGSTEQVGKRVGKDAAAAKQTYPAAFGLEESRRQAWQALAAALDALEAFGPRAERLRELARYVVARDR